MTKILFNKKEQERLKRNSNVKTVSEKAITYSDEFKRHFIAESAKGRVLNTADELGLITTNEIYHSCHVIYHQVTKVVPGMPNPIVN